MAGEFRVKAFSCIRIWLSIGLQNRNWRCEREGKEKNITLEKICTEATLQ
jgi:hypothetical protein